MSLSTSAANLVPLSPIDVPPIATACHEWEAVPGTQVAVLRPAVGTFQLTSPTSVDPYPCEVVKDLIFSWEPISLSGLINVL